MPFHEEQRVSVTYKEKNKIWSGTVDKILPEPKYVGAPEYGLHNIHYVALDDPAAYDELLLQGWVLFCKIRGISERCSIREIKKDDTGAIQTLTVVKENGVITLYPTSYQVSKEDIKSIMIYLVAFDMTPLV